jgi:hypothetical protein
MLHSKCYFALVAAIAVLPMSFFKIANAQVGYSGPYGGYYPIPGGHNMPPLPSPDDSNGSDPAPQIQSPNTSSSTPTQCLPYSQEFNKYMNEMGEIISGKSNSSRTIADILTDQGKAMNALAECVREN